MGVTRAEEEYVPERDEVNEEEDAKEVLGELEQDRTKVDEIEEEAEREPEVVRSDEIVRRAAVVDVVRDVLAKQPVEPARMDALLGHDREAVEFLQSIVDGRTKAGTFVYAERRLEQLNLLLADLQPLLSVGQVEGLDSTMQEVIDGFASLRHELELLEEAQEVIIATGEKKKGEGEGEDDDDDKDDDDKPDEDDKPKSSLAEESAAAAAQQPTPGAATDGKPGDEKKPGLWGRLWNRGKKDEGGGGGA